MHMLTYARAAYFMIFIILYCSLPWLSHAAATCDVNVDADGSCTAVESPSARCVTNEWVSQNDTVPGYHVVCITRDSATNAREIEFYANGGFDHTQNGRYVSSATDFVALRRELERVLKIKKTDASRDAIADIKDKPNAWTIFNPSGARIDDFNDCLGTLLIFEGGVFIYPAIYIGFERRVVITAPDASNGDTQQTTFILTTLSVHPPVFQVKNFIDARDCDHIIALSEPFMKISGVSHMHNTAGSANQWRTSTTHWLHKTDDIIERIEQHCSKLLHVPIENQEQIQVLRYESTQQYDSHWDYFDPSLYEGTEMAQKIRGGRNRLATLFWYMSDVDEGGWTYFPRSGKLKNPSSYKLKRVEDCNVGLKVEPKKGAVILFYSMTPNGQVDPLSLHGACPVGENNTKWGANIWYWTKNAKYY